MKIFRYIIDYFAEVFKAIGTLLSGMKLTWFYFVHPKEIITQQYPENRAELKMFDRFRGEVVMTHNDKNEHRCTGCSACDIACPNGTISVISKFEVNSEGKKKKAIDELVYRLAMCTFCNLCIESCPTGTIVMAQTFEHASYDRTKLTKILNHPGSKIEEGVE